MSINGYAQSMKGLVVTRRQLLAWTGTGVVTEADGFAHVAAGGAQKTLVEQGWRPFLVRVVNNIGTTARLAVENANTWTIERGTGGEGQRRIQVHLRRWIDPSRWGWYSGDTHIRAGGCALLGTELVLPEAIFRWARRQPGSPPGASRAAGGQPCELAAEADSGGL